MRTSLASKFSLLLFSLTTTALLLLALHSPGFMARVKPSNPPSPFLVFNLIVAAIFISHRWPWSITEGVKGAMDKSINIADALPGACTIPVLMKHNDDDDDDDEEEEEMETGEAYNDTGDVEDGDDDIDPEELQYRAEEFISKMIERWLEEGMREVMIAPTTHSW